MDKLKSDIEIIDWLNSLEWIEEVIVSRVEIVGKIGLRTNSMDKQIFNLRIPVWVIGITYYLIEN